MSIEFKAAHADLLEKALNTLGLSYNTNYNTQEFFVGAGIQINLKSGKATIQEGQQDLLNQLKRAYSMEAIKQVAVKNRWVVSKSKPTKGSLIRTY